MRAFNEYAVAFESIPGAEQLRPKLDWYDCDHCGQAVRHGRACRRCGRLAEVLDRVASMQMQATLHMSLMRRDGDVTHLARTNWLVLWSRIWIEAARKLEAQIVEGGGNG